MYRRRSLDPDEYMPKWENEEFFFCHAGVRPGVPLSQQKRSHLVELREPFLSSTKDFGKVVVHGHTITDEPVLKPNRIGIDTGAWQWGPLTAVEVPSRRIWQEYQDGSLETVISFLQRTEHFSRIN